jgi:transglutaminase-like putative cysteine protease
MLGESGVCSTDEQRAGKNGARKAEARARGWEMHRGVMANATATIALRVGCSIEYESDAPTPAVFRLRPETSALHELGAEHWESRPPAPFHDFLDLYGNRCRRLTIPAGRFRLTYDARVETSPEPAATNWSARQLPVEELPDDVLGYTLPSRFCLSDELAADAWRLFGGTSPGWPCVQAICDWVHAGVRFDYAAARPLMSAADVFRDRTGVCRDFAHLAVTFCRAMSIPARYAFGYLPDIGVPIADSPMDFCAWFEAYLGDRWWTFDPRNNQRRIGHLAIGRGRDAIDVPMVTTYGAARFQKMTVWADQVN